jgi:hydrogenase nickel incorporation protein HypA/HybF
MHEVAIMESLHEQLTSLAREHGASRVRRVSVEIGALSNVVPEMLEQAFLAFREVEPLLAGADIDIRRVPLRVRCRACSAETAAEGLRIRCTACGDTAVDVIQGEELLLRDVELEVEDGASEAPSETSQVGIERGAP